MASDDLDAKLVAVTREDISFDELDKIYTEWASDYDRHMAQFNDQSPAMVVKEMKVLLGNKMDARILDVCSGTGTIGIALHGAGYRNVEAVDGNAAMLEEARKKNVYRAFHQHYVGQPLPFQKDAFDMITLFGGLCDGHIKSDCFSCFEDFCRIIRPGGYFFAGIANECLRDQYKQQLESAFQYVVDRGLWESVKNELVTADNYEEQLWIFRIK